MQSLLTVASVKFGLSTFSLLSDLSLESLHLLSSGDGIHHSLVSGLIFQTASFLLSKLLLMGSIRLSLTLLLSLKVGLSLDLLLCLGVGCCRRLVVSIATLPDEGTVSVLEPRRGVF